MNAENDNEWSDEEWFDDVANGIIVEIEKNQLKQAIMKLKKNFKN